jgi:hypothetical protein
VEPSTTDSSVRRAISALLSSERLILREPESAVTAFGGVAVVVSYLDKVGLAGNDNASARYTGAL